MRTNEPTYSIGKIRWMRRCALKIRDSSGNETRCGAKAFYCVKYRFETKWGVRYWRHWACAPCADLWARRHHLHFPERNPPAPQESIGQESGV